MATAHTRASVTKLVTGGSVGNVIAPRRFAAKYDTGPPTAPNAEAHAGFPIIQRIDPWSVGAKLTQSSVSQVGQIQPASELGAV